MGRRFVGIEVSEYYHRIAEERHKMIEDGDDPFAKRNETHAAKNSRVERLPKQRYAISKKTLQFEIRRIAQALGHIPTRDEVRKSSQYPMRYFDEYFVSWGEACAAARHADMSESPVPELLRSQQLTLL